MAGTKIITVKVGRDEKNIKITNTNANAGGTREVSIPFEKFVNIGTTDRNIPGVEVEKMNLETFSKQQRYLNWLDSWKDLKAGGGDGRNYSDFVNGLGVWSDGYPVDEPNMRYTVLHDIENNVINSVIDTLTNRSWTKVKKRSNLDKKLAKERVQHDCGLGFDSFIEEGVELYKTLGTFLDPAGDIQGGKNYPEQNQEIKFEKSFMNAMGFPGETYVSGTPNSRDKNDWRYEIKYGSGCVPAGECTISRDKERADAEAAAAAIVGGEHRAFNKQTTDPNRKFFGGNNQKGSVLNNPNASSNDKRKLIVSKELGDRMQIFCHMVMVHLNTDKEIVLITCDMVVFITCIILRLPVIYTGTSLVKNPEYCKALGVDPTIMEGKFYSITEYNPNSGDVVKKLREKYTKLRKSIIDDNQKLIDLVSKFAQREDGFTTIGITQPGSGGVPQQTNVPQRFFYRILAVLYKIRGKLRITEAGGVASVPPRDNVDYKDAMERLDSGDQSQGIMPTGGEGDYPEYKNDVDVVTAAGGVDPSIFLNNKIKNIKRDCLLLHFIHIKKGQDSFSINPSIKSFTATKPAQNNKTFFGDGYTRGMTIHDIARDMISDDSLGGGGGGKHTTQTGGNVDPAELFKDYEDAGEVIVHINCEKPILEEHVRLHIGRGTEVFPDIKKDEERENCVIENKSKEFVDDSLKLVDKIITAIGVPPPSPSAPLTIEQKRTIGDYVQNIRRYLNCVYDIGFDDNKSLISIASQDSWFKEELEGIIKYILTVYYGVENFVARQEVAEYILEKVAKNVMAEAGAIDVPVVTPPPPAGTGAAPTTVADSAAAAADRADTVGRSHYAPQSPRPEVARVPRIHPVAKKARREASALDQSPPRIGVSQLSTPAPPAPAAGGKRKKRRTKKHAKKRTRNGKRRYTRNKKRPHNKKKRRANKKAKTHRKKPRKSKKGRKTTRKHLRRRSR